MLQEILDNFPENSILRADGFDDAVIGIDEKSMRLIYSVKKCIEILVAGDLSEEEAVEYLQFNTFDAFVGDKTPIWCMDYFIK
jgi:hypothetical protein